MWRLIFSSKRKVPPEAVPSLFAKAICRPGITKSESSVSPVPGVPETGLIFFAAGGEPEKILGKSSICGTYSQESLAQMSILKLSI